MARAPLSQWQGEPLLVLDIETRVCSLTRGRLRDDVRNAISHAPLAEITCISALECYPGAPSTYRLTTFASSERDDLRALSRMLERLPDMALLTFNGRRHDVPVIELRSIHHMIMGAVGIGSLHKRTHYDLMEHVDGHCSLASLRACFNLQPDDVIPTARKRSPTEQKCEIDVVTTFLSFLHLRALRTAAPTEMLSAWRDLASHFSNVQPGHVHLSQLFRAVR